MHENLKIAIWIYQKVLIGIVLHIKIVPMAVIIPHNAQIDLWWLSSKTIWHSLPRSLSLRMKRIWISRPCRVCTRQNIANICWAEIVTPESSAMTSSARQAPWLYLTMLILGIYSAETTGSRRKGWMDPKLNLL